MMPARTTARIGVAAATRFCVHYSDGDIRTLTTADPQAAREAGKRVGVTILKIERDRSEEPRHLAFVTNLPSIVSGEFGVEACHLRMAAPQHGKSSTGKSRKPSDEFVLPLTPAERREQQTMAEREFWEMHGIADPCGSALLLDAVAGNEAEALKVIMHAGARG